MSKKNFDLATLVKNISKEITQKKYKKIQIFFLKKYLKKKRILKQ